jgi:predicted O-linked N-acetylglucosamine transferase (SPINDLY family)
VAKRIIFTDVAPKHLHISRARVCDLFLDTPECNAHTTAADVLWSGTPLLTERKYEWKMCSRMAASILRGALPKGEEGDKAARLLTTESGDEYEDTAVMLAKSLQYGLVKLPPGPLGERREVVRSRGHLSDLRKLLYTNRWSTPLFDTKRWVRDLETAYERAWGMWVKGEGGDIWL